MAKTSVQVRVPATVGNFGGALNCAALALDAPLNVKVTPRIDGHVGIRYFGENGERVPRDRSNLVVRAMEAAMQSKGLRFTGADFEIYSSVPVAVGLGSSTAAILAGVIAADQLYDLSLDEKTVFDLAATYETRADNVRAAWWGGFVTSTGEGTNLAYHRSVVPEDFSLTVITPETSLQPSSAQRSADQDHAGHAIRAEALREFFARLGDAAKLVSDEPLPPTCEKNVPGLEEALKVQAPGVLSVFVCGSGPAVGVLAREDHSQAVRAVRECFMRHGVVSTLGEFRPTNAGARDLNNLPLGVLLLPPRGQNISLSALSSTRN